MTEETLFELALKTPPSERLALIQRASEGNARLRARVEQLLAAHESSNAAVDNDLARLRLTVDSAGEPEMAFTATQSEPEGNENTGATFGRYTLEKRLGEGGMGSVWVAKQSEPVKRRVALKLIKIGMDSRSVLQRFEAERQALAVMDHPHIARVFDGGLLPDGRPFFAMELVNGLPINKFCDDAKLGTRQRLELFVKVCQAVQHAHQKGVIHRDLKPANILVTQIDGTPEPKVIDFGVAKAVGGKLHDAAETTQFGAIVGTLEYMAPEQAGYSGADIDTRADIYALGVILYELITGLRPFDSHRLKRAALDEIIRIIREEEPSKPSTRLSSSDSLPSSAAIRHSDPKRLVYSLRGDLDWIAMKCLEKDRNRRYESANGLAADVQRHLADEPVLASPPSALYRFRKLVRRHRPQAIATALVLLTLLGGIGGTTLGFIRAESARREESKQRSIAEEREQDALNAASAEREAKLREAEQRAKAEAARDRTCEVLDAVTSDAAGDSLATQHSISEEQRKFLQEVLIYYKEFAGGSFQDERSRQRTASAAFKVGIIERRLGRQQESAAAFRIARDGFASLAREFPTTAIHRQEQARSHNDLANLLVVAENRAEADHEYRSALDIQERLIVDFPNRPEYQQELARCLGNYASLLNLGKKAEAEKRFRRASSIQEKLVAEFTSVTAYRMELAATYNNLGNLFANIGKRNEAEVEYRKALAIQEKLAAQFPAAPAFRQKLARSRNNLGVLLSSQGRLTDAEREHRRSIETQSKLAAQFPSTPEYRQDLARSHNNLATLLDDLKNFKGSEIEYQKASAILEVLAAEFPAVPENRLAVARTRNNLGALFDSLERRAEAEAEYRKAIEIQERIASEFPTMRDCREELARSYFNLGVLLTSLGKLDGSEAEYRRSLPIQQSLVDEYPQSPSYRRSLANTHNNLGFLLAGLGKRGENAEAEYRSSLLLRQRLADEFPSVVDYRKNLALSHHNLADLLVVLEKASDAERNYRSALSVRERLAVDFPAIPQFQADASQTSYCVACFHAVAAGKAVNGNQEHAGRAIELLQRAIATGFNDAARVAKDPSLDPLRKREDFKKLLADLQKKSVAGPAKQ